MNKSIDIVDFHAHILPRADHGSSSVEVTLAQLKLAKESGVCRIVATPHFYPNSHTVDAFLKRREAAYNALRDVASLDMPKIALGAEVLLCENLHKLDGLSSLTLEGTNVLLLELPYQEIEDAHVQTVASLISCGYRIILAHADKYAKADVEKMLILGASIQLNANALTSWFTPRHILDWIERGAVVCLGSDIHGKDKHAYTRFVKAKNKFKDKIFYLKDQSDSLWKLSEK